MACTIVLVAEVGKVAHVLDNLIKQNVSLGTLYVVNYLVSSSSSYLYWSTFTYTVQLPIV